MTDDGAAPSSPPPAAAGDEGESAAAPAAASPQEEGEKFDFGEKRKKVSKKEREAKEAPEEETIRDGTGNIFKRGPVMTYEQMLERMQILVQNHNPDLAGTKRYTLKPPQVVRVGSKKVAWINFKDICSIMNRNQDHVHQFVLAELGTEGSIAGDGQLVLKGKYGPKHIEALLRKYITEYVTCQMCKSPKTAMEKDPRTRLWTQKCDACGANRSVTTIKSGFHAVGRGERRKAKMG